MEERDRQRRMDKMLLLVVKGYPYRAIGSVFGITGERVAQLVHRNMRTNYSEVNRELLALFRDKENYYGWTRELKKRKNRIITLIKARGFLKLDD